MHKKSAIAAAVALLAGATALPALAQNAQPETLDQVTITGSRLIRPNLTAPTPVLSLGQETFGVTGTQNFADVATQLPQFAASFGTSRTQSTFSGVENSGLNTVNLRNLGSVRSLVLINGRRVPGGLSTDPSVDFNTIPSANIERIEVITGGASAIYGADAVAGVVNIITKKRFEGIEVGLGYGQAEGGDNRNPNAHIMFGGKIGDGGRALLTLQLDRQGQVKCADRYLCAEDFAWLDPEAGPVRGASAQSGVGLNGRFFGANGNYTRRGDSFTDANGNLIPFATAIDGYNRNRNRDLAIPTKRTMLAGEMEIPLNAKTQAFAELNFGQSTVRSNFEAHPFQSSANSDKIGGNFGTQITIPWNNPFIPSALLADQPAGQTEMTWWQRMAGLGGNRGADSERSSLRTVIGLKGEMALIGPDPWNWEVSNTYGRTRVNLGTQGLVNKVALYNGLRVEADPANPGSYRCIDPLARAQGCVPINPFAPYTSAMTAYAADSSTAVGTATLNDTIAHVTGSPFEGPAGPVRMVLGAEYRMASGGLDYSDNLNRGLVTGNQLLDTNFIKQRTRDVFGELLIPLLADKPGARSLNFETAYRGSQSGDWNYNTWKIGGDWEPAKGLRLRVMQAKSVRTPVPGELSGGGSTAGVVNDPCTAARRNANPTRAANCAADGIPDGYTPPLVVEQGVSGFSLGNGDLKPEEGKTRTFGLVWEPTKDFSISIDRFDIRLTDVISSVERQTAANLCYDTPNRLYCNELTRGTNPLVGGGAATYVLTAVNERIGNIAEQTVKGVDIDVRYGRNLPEGWGHLDTSFITTLYDKASFVPLRGEATVNLLGQAGGSTGDQGFIRMTANATANWTYGKWKTTWNLRFIGAADMSVDAPPSDGWPRIGAHTYHNVRVGYGFAKDSEAFVGITNLFDKAPPFFATGTSGTQALDTIPAYYDVFGRSFFVGLRAKF